MDDETFGLPGEVPSAKIMNIVNKRVISWKLIANTFRRESFVGTLKWAGKYFIGVESEIDLLAQMRGCILTLKATVQEPQWIDRGYVYWKVDLHTWDGLEVIAVDVIGKMSARAYIRLTARHQCPRQYVEFFVAYALQSDAQAVKYNGSHDMGTYIVTIPDDVKMLERMVAKGSRRVGARG